MRAAWLKPGPVWPKDAPLLADDANTVSHLYWRNGSLIDTKGLGWGMSGTVPMASGTTLIPPGAGPFSDANYYSITNAALQFAGDFLISCVYASSSNPNDNALALGTAYSGAGYALLNGGGLNAAAYVNSSLAGDNAAHPAGALCVTSFGRTGTTVNAVTNAGILRTTATTTGSVSAAVYLGRYASAGVPWTGRIIEVLFSTLPASLANLQAMNAAVKAAVKNRTVW